MIAPFRGPGKRTNFPGHGPFILLMLLFMMLSVQDDLEARERAFDALRRGGSIHELLRNLDSPDPEIRARSSDVLLSLSPLAWLPFKDDPRGLRLRSPAPPDAERRSRDFLEQEPVNFTLMASTYGQALLRHGEGSGLTIADGVIWLGARPPSLASWLLNRLDDPEALWILAQMLTPERIAGLLEDPRPEAVDLLLHAQVLRKGPLDPRLARRMSDRFRTLDAGRAAPASIVARTHAAELSGLLNEGARSSNRFWRLIAATLAPKPEPDVFMKLLSDPEREIRHAALSATLSRIPVEAWDCEAILDAGELCAFTHGFALGLRQARQPRLQAAAAERLPRAVDLALLILEDCEDPAILDRAVAALKDQAWQYRKSTALLRRMTETSDDPMPRNALKLILLDGDTDKGERAAYALGGLPASEILGFLEEQLDSAGLTVRRNVFWALCRVGAEAGPGSCVAERVRAILRRRLEHEADPYLARDLERQAGQEFFDVRVPHRMLRLQGRFGCGGGRVSHEQGGWLPRPSPAVAFPAEWN